MVDGFEGDRFGIVYKTHHAMADGISAVDIGVLLFDVEPKSEPVREVAPWTPNSPPTKAHLLGRALRGLGATVTRTAALAAPRRRQSGTGEEAGRRRRRRVSGRSPGR